LGGFTANAKRAINQTLNASAAPHRKKRLMCGAIGNCLRPCDRMNHAPMPVPIMAATINTTVFVGKPTVIFASTA
jgi:hypothetical protein